jgi:predicted ester cyclase
LCFSSFACKLLLRGKASHPLLRRRTHLAPCKEASGLFRRENIRDDVQKGRKSMPSEDNIALVRRYLDEVVHTGKMGVDSSLLATDHVAHNAGSPPAQGHEVWKQGAVALYSAFPDIHVTFEDEMAMGDKVVIRWRVRATHKGALSNIPATGKPVTWTGITIVRVADGKIVEQWQEVDLLGLMQQLGVIPSMGESGGS